MVNLNTRSACVVWPKDTACDSHADNQGSKPGMRICFFDNLFFIIMRFFNHLDFMLTPVVFHGHNVVDVIDRIGNFKQD